MVVFWGVGAKIYGGSRLANSKRALGRPNSMTQLLQENLRNPRPLDAILLSFSPYALHPQPSFGLPAPDASLGAGDLGLGGPCRSGACGPPSQRPPSCPEVQLGSCMGLKFRVVAFGPPALFSFGLLVIQASMTFSKCRKEPSSKEEAQ